MRMNEAIHDNFYQHLDGSIVCKKCEKTLKEGCKCYFVKEYSEQEVAHLIEQAMKLKIVLYRENTLSDIEVLVKQELLKLMGTPEKYD